MKTKHWKVQHSADAMDPNIQDAAQLIREGRTVAFPTETVYGIGADARSSEAVKRIFTAKGRPSDNPLIVHIAHRSQLEGVVDTSNEAAGKLMSHFWPGPLTLVLPILKGTISSAVTAGLDTLAVRMPDHPVALSLITASGCLLAAPSANRSGRPSPTKAEHVKDDLEGLVDGLLDGGPTGLGLESTVVEFVGERVNILRPGGITLEQLREIVPHVTLDASLLQMSAQQMSARDASPQDSAATNLAPRSPGMKYAHYAPQGEFRVVKGSSPEEVILWIQNEVDAASQRGECTGILCFDEHAGRYHADIVLSCGRLNYPEEMAHQLYDLLRKFDQEQVTYILAEACTEEGIGLAVMNRLVKASGDKVVQI